MRGQARSCCSRRTRSNARRLCGTDADSAYVKDAIHDHVVHGEQGAVNPERAAPRPRRTTSLTIPARRVRGGAPAPDQRRERRADGSPFGAEFDAVFADRIREADEFYATVATPDLVRGRAPRAAAGFRRPALDQAVLPLRRAALAARRPGRGPRRRASAWRAATATGRTSTTPTSSRCPTSGSTPGTPPGTWRSTAIPLALIDPDFAKEQLMLLLREWYMHPNGQLPAYEWDFRRRESRPCTPGPPGASTRSTRSAAGRATASSWSASSTSCC